MKMVASIEEITEILKTEVFVDEFNIILSSLVKLHDRLKLGVMIFQL